MRLNFPDTHPTAPLKCSPPHPRGGARLPLLQNTIRLSSFSTATSQKMSSVVRSMETQANSCWQQWKRNKCCSFDVSCQQQCFGKGGGENWFSLPLGAGGTNDCLAVDKHDKWYRPASPPSHSASLSHLTPSRYLADSRQRPVPVICTCIAIGSLSVSSEDVEHQRYVCN